MLLLSFIRRRFWWPRRRRFFFFGFLFYIFNKKKKSRPYFAFPQNNRISIKIKKKFFRFFSFGWLLKRFRKYRQRRLFSFYSLNSRIERAEKFLERKRMKFARVTLRFTTNNTFLTISDTFSEKVLIHYSSGSVGFSGPTRTTLFASEQIVDKACKFLKKRRFFSVHLVVLSGGFGYKSKSILESLASHKLRVRALTYKLSITHNGIRLRKTKRR